MEGCAALLVAILVAAVWMADNDAMDLNFILRLRGVFGAMIHQHSIAAYHSEADKLSRRAWLVLAWIDLHGPATDREVMQGMGFKEPNCVRPRITELIEAGKLIEKDSKRCPVTGKTVRIVAMAPRQMELMA